MVKRLAIYFLSFFFGFTFSVFGASSFENIAVGSLLALVSLNALYSYLFRSPVFQAKHSRPYYYKTLEAKSEGIAKPEPTQEAKL